MTKLPGFLADVERVAGLAAALSLAREHGGTRKMIPTPDNLGGDHWLVRCVGQEAAEKIAGHFAQQMASGNDSGEKVLIPMGPTGTLAQARRRMAEALAEGATVAEAARRAGMHERTAYRRKKWRPDPRQQKLL